MDRKPLPPPFPVGTRLRYVGTRKVWMTDANGNDVPLLAPGVEVTINLTEQGFQGTLRPIRAADEYGDEPVLDRTVDGYSIYHVQVPGKKPQGRCILREYAHEWEVVD